MKFALIILIFLPIACTTTKSTEDYWIGRKIVDGYVGNHPATSIFDSLGYKVYYFYNRSLGFDSTIRTHNYYSMVESEGYYFTDDKSIIRKIIRHNNKSKVFCYYVDSISRQTTEHSEGWNINTKYHLTIDSIKNIHN